MPSVQLHPPGDVNEDAISSVGGSPLPTVVGSPPQWSDNSDSTYAVVVNDNVRGKEDATALLPATSLPQPPSSFTWHVRASGTGSPFPFRVALEVTDYSAGGQVNATPTDTAQWFSATEAINYPDLVTPDLAAGNASVRVGQYDVASTAQDVYIYEVWIEITYGGVPRNRAARRLYPRDDGLGVGAGHIWPPPRTWQRGVRSVGGYL